MTLQCIQSAQYRWTVCNTQTKLVNIWNVTTRVQLTTKCTFALHCILATFWKCSPNRVVAGICSDQFISCYSFPRWLCKSYSHYNQRFVLSYTFLRLTLSTDTPRFNHLKKKKRKKKKEFSFTNTTDKSMFSAKVH